ncbi:terminase small subunit [Cognatiyoonia sp. IB215446]|uniref:terminase small subunit n=1 Tax=Cognatiyoonia sp. IB215446 TaxID=3097355 RepID=UPI002A13721B|nr:terminase small subunit [Cognatiyoonia sp. IB215446]MDX8348559.1 terminase small subunit [Cognatiyoonia sp. IB215446]
MALNAKQAQFAREYIIDFNATQAAIRAGYSKKTAGPQGARLLSNAKRRAGIIVSLETKTPTYPDAME